MRKPHIFIELAKNRGARTLAAIAVLLLVMQPFAFAMEQTVYKYPSDSTVATQDIGNSHMLDIGSVFNFNNAKALSTICLKPGEPGYPEAGCTDNLSLSEVDESNCDPEATVFPFGSGADGWEGANVLPSISVNMKFLYDATNEAINVNLTRKNQTGTFEYTKKFFYECGTPGMSDFKIRYRMLSVTGMGAAGTNNFKVDLIKPLGGIVNLVPLTSVLVGDTNYLWKPGPASTDTFVIPTANWNESGVYKIKISGQLKTGTSQSSNVTLQFDDITLNKTSLWTDYKHDVEYFVKAAPYSQLGGYIDVANPGGYLLEIKAAKKSSAADNVNVLVYNGATWTNKGSISQVYNETLPQNNLQVLPIPLTAAEYNNGLVRVRYVDATQSGDPTPGGVYIDYQRIEVDQGICVQEVRAIEADCGKCHNYGGDVTKPWPLQGMHNKHAQTESVSDCAWCHPDVTVGGTVFPSDHMNGVQDGRAIELAGTKIYRLGGANPQGAVGSWDPATGQCTLSDCHNGLLTPAWTATYGATNGELNGTTIIARNCSRCHNTGINNSAPAAADVNNLNIAAAWPDTLAHREHDNAFNMDENSCQANGSCHPDNRVQHTPVKDAAGVSTLMSPKYQSPSGSGVKYLKVTTAVGDGRCYNATCHGGQETPLWNATVGSLDPIQGNAYCKACHKGEKATTWTPGAILPDISAKQYNSPISGLHQGSPPTSGKSHVSEYGCAVCHTSNPTLHFKDGVGTTNLDTWQMDPVGSTELVATMGYSAVGRGTPPSYSDGAAPTCATPYPGPGGLTCHAETDTASVIGKLAGTNTPWARDWSWDAYSSTAADRCKVCHGVYGSFKNLRPAHTSPKLAGNHSDNGLDCATTCHAQTDNETVTTASIYNHGVSLTADAKSIDVNMNVGFTQYPTAMETGTTGTTYTPQVYYTQTGTTDSVGCTGCHDNGQTTPRFSLQESGWKLRNQLTGPGVTCDNDAAGCHGNNTANQIWPDGTGGAVYPDRVGKHQEHMTKLAAKLTITLATATEAQQKQMCTYCHGALATIGAAGHTSDGTANQAEATGFLRLWNATADATGSAATYSNDANATCSGIDCHNNKATTATYNWRTGVASACTMCHTPGGASNDPTSGLHTGTLTVSGVNHDDSFATGGTCTTCHTAVPVLTSTSAHINGTFTVNEATATNEYYTFPAYTDAAANAGTCSGTAAPPNGVSTGCHSIDPIDGGTWKRVWNVSAKLNDGTQCANCHGGFNETDWTFGMDTVTTDNNVSHNHNWDGDGSTGEVIGFHQNTTANSTKCNICHVYADSPYTTGAFTTYHRNRLITMNSTMGYDTTTAALGGCSTNCHQVPANHTMERASSANFATRGQSVAGPALSCGACHTGGVRSGANSGAHEKHGATSASVAANPAAIALCIQCHGNDGTGATHNNASLNWATNLTYSAARGVLTGNCTGTAGCHVQTTNIAWNVAQSNCDQCHSSTTDTNNFGWTGTAGNISRVSSTEFSAVGHGSAANGAKTCLNCHDIAVVHDTTATLTGTNPYRLIDQDTGTAGLQFSCSYNNAACHLSTTATNEAALGLTYGAIKNHERANFTAPGVDTWSFAPKCVDCHDPHGDGSNVKMIQKDLWDNGSGATMVPTDYGTIGNTNLTFTANTTGQDATGNAYADIDTPWSSICQECHETADVDFTSYKDGVNSNVSPHPTSPGDCSGCHKHSGGFKPEGCAGCHGGANATWSNKNMWPDLAAGAYPKRAGKHEVHINRLMSKLGYLVATITDDQQKQMCTYCHGALATIGASSPSHETDGTANQAEFPSASILRIWNATADATAPAAAFTAADGSCSGIDCHNNKTTPSAPTDLRWRGAGTSTCTMCHTPGGAANDPTSGLHTGTLTVSGVTHDDSFATGGTCTTCHTAVPVFTSSSAHINGTFTVNEATATNEYYTFPAYTDAAANAGTCSGTSAPPNGVATGCHSIDPIDGGTWARKWNVSAKLSDGTQCANCHGGFNETDWTFGMDTVTNDYNVSHNNNWDADGSSGEVIGFHQGTADNYTKCNICHIYADAPYTTGAFATYHRNRLITMNSTMGYDTTTAALGGCTTNCHDAVGPHTIERASSANFATRGQAVAGPALSCTSCHTGSGGGAKNVGPASTHVKVLKTGSFGACTNCHNNHTGAAVGGIIIPNNTTVGINYSTTGHSGIQLGGAGTDASISGLTSEAAICWACHALPANLISEWGANTDPSTGNSTYNYGSVTTPDWTTATWSSSRPTQFAYKSGAIQSTHTANPAVTDAALGGAAYTRTETKNASNLIRCSNCHDVHELGLATGDKKEGTPYLRGSWMGNPYEEDGAPRSVYANTTYFPNIVFPTRTYGWGAVPRGSILQGRLGGYWIDQNNVTPMTATTTANGTARLNPTATWEPLDTNAEAGNSGATSPAFAGLCMLCHDNAGATTALKIDALDKAPGEAIWLGTNGHANSVKGGTGATSGSSFNVFDARLGVTTYSDNPRQHYNGMVEPGRNGAYGFRALQQVGYTPNLSSTYGYGYAQDTWVVDETGATKESAYHKFSCSKCHNPHASRLPKLMITNCLDTVHNTWDNQFQLNAKTGNNLNKEVAQWTSAQNCHRYSQNTNATTTSPEYRASRTAGAAGTGAGWNKVTPWMQTTTTP